MELTWQETAKGTALRIQVDGKHVSFYPYELVEPERVAAIAALSLWEGMAGLPPRSLVARWLWRRGLRKLQHEIARELKDVGA